MYKKEDLRVGDVMVFHRGDETKRWRITRLGIKVYDKMFGCSEEYSLDFIFYLRLLNECRYYTLERSYINDTISYAQRLDNDTVGDGLCV